MKGTKLAQDGRQISCGPLNWALCLGALLSFTGNLTAQTYTVTNFASGFFSTNGGYESPFSLDGQPFYPTNPNSWQTTDPEQPSVGGTNFGATSIVQPWAFYTFGDTSTNGNNSVLFGGFSAPAPTPTRLLPGTTNPSLFVSGFVASPEPALSATFSADFAIMRPAGPQGIYTNRDSFGFTLWDTFGTSQIGKFMFNGSAPTVLAGTTNYGFQWFDSSNTWQSNSPALTATNWQIALNTIYRLNVTLSNNGTFDANVQTILGQLDLDNNVTNYAVVSTTAFISGGSLGGYLPEDLSSISLDWSLASADPMLPGANFLVVNQVNVVSLVPEPSTVALLAASALGFVALNLRRLASKKQASTPHR